MKEQITIITDDHFEISSTLFSPNSKAKAGVIINSATAVKQSYYFKFAQHLSEQGYAVFTYDYRGIGASSIENYRDKRLSMKAWGKYDLAAVITKATKIFPNIDWHCIGHSVGGQIIGFASNNDQLKSIYCVSSQSGYWGHWESINKPKMIAMWYAIIPALSFTLGKVPGALLGGESLPSGIAKQWAYWGRHRDYIVDRKGKAIRKGFDQISCPMHFLHIDDDLEFAPPKAVKALSGFYENAETRIETLNTQEIGQNAIGHFGFFRSENKAKLWHKPLDWLKHAA